MRIRILCLCSALLWSAGCDDNKKTEDPGAGAGYVGVHVETLKFGANDNSEVIKMLPDGTRAVLVASKSRKVTLLGLGEDGLTELRSAFLFADDTSESELTHIDFDSQARFAAVTRTKPIKDAGALVGCEGSLVFVDVSNSDAFGTVLNEIPIGPMPDAVDISSNDRYIVTADEVDAYDKCDLADVIPSITLIDLPDGDPTAAVVRGRIIMEGEVNGQKREPEQIVFASDDDTVMSTLQDTHEVIVFKRSAVLEGAGADPVEVGSSQLKVVRLPDRSTGAEPWPDGVNHFFAADGREYFIVAGEFNDTFTILDLDGGIVRNVEIAEADVPDSFPRESGDGEAARFRPDSVATFRYGDVAYAAFSLKHAGAVGVWRIDDPQNPVASSMIKVGKDEGAGPNEASTLGTEGISAHDSGRIVTANEKESSASLIAPLR